MNLLTAICVNGELTAVCQPSEEEEEEEEEEEDK